MFSFQPENNFLANRTLLITGASDGIGKTCARTFASYGATQILLGRSQEKLEALYDELEELNPGNTVIHPLDLSMAGSDDYALLASSVSEQFGTLDLLLHNAALLGARSPIEYYPDSDWQQLMTVNVNAAFYLTKALLPSLSNSDRGRILFTSSSVGRQGRAFWGAYAVSKFAVEGLMQTLADELGTTSSITVNSINPGGTRTGMREAAYPAENPESVPTAETLMPVYLYLLGEKADSINGQAINVRNFDPEEFK